MSMQNKPLQRSLINRKIAGVAGGLAEHFDIDPVFIRILFVLAFFFGGGGLLIYIILWIVIPENKPYINNNYQNTYQASNSSDSQNYQHPENQYKEEPQQTTQSYDSSQPETKPDNVKKGNFVIGLILIVIGSLFLIDRFLEYINISDFWPVVFIALGIGLIVNSLYKKQ